MNSKEFDRLLNKRLELIKNTLLCKGREYSNSKDRFHNFGVAARIANESQEKALFGMALKHLVSIIDIIENIEIKRQYPSDDLLKEKCGDLINYIIMLEIMIKKNKGLQSEKM